MICADDCGLDPAGGGGWERFHVPGPASGAALLQQNEVQSLLRSRREAVLLWKSSAEVEHLADRVGIAVANSPALIARRIENKSYFSRRAQEVGLPVPDTRSGVAGPDLLRSTMDLRGPWIFQLAHSFSGEQTFLVESEEQLEAVVARFSGRICRVAEQVSGTPVTVTGIVSQDQVWVGPACRQLTGLPLLTPHPLGSCGNDYRQPVPRPEAVRDLAIRAGDWLRQEGHRGVFGLDVVVGEEGSIWCIEVNPRLVASVPLFSLTARDSGAPGLLAGHLAAFGIGPGDDWDLACDWSQVILYQRGARRPHSDLTTVQGAVTESGTFRSSRQMGLEGPPPGKVGLFIQGQSRPGKELARLIFEGPCCAENGSLLPHLSRCVGQLRSRLEEPEPDESVS